MTEQTTCSSCGYKLKKDETIVNNRCPMCEKVFKNIKEKKEKDSSNVVCPKCNYRINSTDNNSSHKCPKCGVIYSDYYNSIIKKLSEQNDELIKKIQTPKDISFKPLLIPLWILIIVNIVAFSYKSSVKIEKVDGSKVTPVYIAGSETLPISIEYVSGNVPVIIKGPLSTGGNVCARPCGY